MKTTEGKIKGTVWCELAVFLALLIVAGLFLAQIFRYRDVGGGAGFDTFYALDKDSVDVMFFGSSHAHCSFDIRKLWDDAGIASVSLTAGDQWIDGTYLFVKEALKTQHPKVIFVETLNVAREMEPDEAHLYRTDLSTKWSMDQAKLVGEQAADYPLDDDTRNNLLLRFPILHARYQELTRADFVNPYPWRMGYIGSNEAESTSFPVMTNGVGEISQGGKNYLRKIMQLCQKEDVPVVFICAPFPASLEQSREQNAIGAFIQDEGGIFLNGNMLAGEMGIDFTTDIRDGSHLNDAGAEKFTQYVEDYILAHYQVEDHRADPAYYRWDQNSRYLDVDRQAQYSLAGAVDFNDYMNRLAAYREDFTVIVSLNGNYAALGEETYLPGLQAMGLDAAFGAAASANAGGTLIMQNGHIIYNSGTQTAYSYTMTSHGEQKRVLSVQRRDLKDSDYSPGDAIGDVTTYTGLYLDETDHGGAFNGMDVLVYDEELDFLVDIIHVNVFESVVPMHEEV